MFEIIVLVIIIVILYNLLYYSKEKFSGEIDDNEFPDKEIINFNNDLNNYYQNNNDYYQNQTNYQKKGQYGLLKANNINYEKYYEMYKHQLNCPCEDKKELGFNNCENDLDVFKLSNMALSNNKKKPCVSCNFNTDIGAVLTPEQKKEDFKNVKKNSLRSNNVNKYAAYKEYVNQNSNQFESQVDKLGQCRTSETCELNKFGDTIWDAYDNLLSTDFTKYQTTTNPDILTGTNNVIFTNIIVIIYFNFLFFLIFITNSSFFLLNILSL